MKKLDEIEIIKKFQKAFGNKDFEDVETFELGQNKVVVKVDTLVQSSDIPPQMKLADAARKSVVASVSDFASKGAKPKFGIVSVNLPLTITSKEVNEIARGFKIASKEFGIRFLGGDTNQGKEIVFHVCLFGEAKKILKRKGAKIGDSIFVSGPFGFTGAGLEILLQNIKEDDNFSKIAKKSVQKPSPRLEFGVKGAAYFSSSMDSSDGLSTTLNEMARQSKSKFVIRNIPTKKSVQEFARKHKKNFESLVFHSGEEYEIVFTAPKRYKSKIISIAKSTKTPIVEIGVVRKGKGVFLEKDQRLVKLKDLGYYHFNSKA